MFAHVEMHRPDLRFPFPARFQERLTGGRVEFLDRRGKYLIARLSTGENLIMHLGMSGRFTIAERSKNQPGAFTTVQKCNPAHDHVVFHVESDKRQVIIYNDPRRFGFMDIVNAGDLETCKHFKAMGPEPLGNTFTSNALNISLKGRLSPVKAALLDQRVVAGLGNIYACEALYRARVSPRRKAASVCGIRGERLHGAILSVLRDAIAAGGSTLRDFAGAGGDSGYFQHRFDVYGREGEPCLSCGGTISRIIQSGRSTFFCGHCQR